MKKSFVSLLYYVLFDITMDSSKYPTTFRVHLVLILYFSHTLSPLFKLHYHEFEDILDSFLPCLSFYSNFSNIMSYLKNSNIFILTYILAFSIVTFPLFYVLYATIIQIYFKIMISEKSILKKACVLIFQYFNWILLIPILEIFINPLDCDWYRFSIKCYDQTAFFIISSIMGITWALFFGIIIVYSSKNYKFLQTRMEFDWSFLRLIIFLLRNSQIVLFILFKKWPIFSYLSFHLFGIFSFLEHFYYNSIGNKKSNENYLYYLCVFEGILILMTFWNYIGIITNDNIFYFLLIMFLLTYKLGKKLFEMRNEQKLMIKPFVIDYFDKVLEEIKANTDKNVDKAKAFKIFGYFKTHFKENCSDPNCLDFKKKFKSDPYKFIFNDSDVNSFIISKFASYINNKDLKWNDEKKTEIILKYIDFLKLYSFNPKKLLFDFEKMKQKISKNSYFLKQLLEHLNTSIKGSIFHDNDLLSDKIKEQNLQYQNFFKMNKYKYIFIDLIKDVLKEKKTFWTDYSIGFKKMEHFIDSIQNLGMKIEHFKNFIQKKNSMDTTCKIIALKAFSLLYSVFFNEISLGLKFEEEYKNIYSNELIIKDTDKNKLSFINQDIIFCEASFLTYEGIIKSSSKTQKLGNFFGYNKREVQSIKKIEDLMPFYFKSTHQQFVKNYINKLKSSLTKYPIKTYALHKNNCIIPISLYVTLRYVSNDFVLMAAIQYDEINDDSLIIYNGEGEILGISQKMLNFFISILTDFNMTAFQSLNIFECFNELKTISQCNLHNEFILNQHGLLMIPLMKDNISQKKSSHSLALKNHKFDIDFNLTIHKSSFSETGQITVFNMSIKNIVLLSEDIYDNSEISLKYLKDFEENIHDSFYKPNEMREEPCSMVISAIKGTAFISNLIERPLVRNEILQNVKNEIYDDILKKPISKNKYFF